VTDIELGAFLSGPRNPEHEALLRLIGASIPNPRGAEADDEPAAVNIGREWSDGELSELATCSCAASQWRRSRDFCVEITAKSKTRWSK